MAYEHILVETRGAVGLVILNRPEALNALCAALIKELAVALDVFEADDVIGAIVLTGSEKAFAAGADIKEMSGRSYMDVYLSDFITVGWERVSTCRKPIVAAVAGYALAGGCEMAMMCDYIIAADTARFGQPEITIGAIPGAGGTQRLPRVIPVERALDMIVSGQPIKAEKARELGLVDFLADGDLIAAAVKFCSELPIICALKTNATPIAAKIRVEPLG